MKKIEYNIIIFLIEFLCYCCYSKLKMVADLNLPVAILIFEDPNQQIYYRAYSSSQYILSTDSSVQNIQQHQYGQFIAHIYNRLALDQQNILNNDTQYGKLKEVFIRFLDIPIAQRGPICYFSTYNHPHCNYRTVHRQSPIYFTAEQLLSYGTSQPNLVHFECYHEII